MRVTSAFSRLLRLKGVWVKKVRFEPGRVVVEVALRRRRLVCPLCEHSARARKDTRPEDSVLEGAAARQQPARNLRAIPETPKVPLKTTNRVSP